MRVSFYNQVINILNSTTVLLKFASNSDVSLPKCCESHQVFSISESKCVGTSSLYLNSSPYLDPSKYKISYGMPCGNYHYKYRKYVSLKIYDFYKSGDLLANLSINNVEKELPVNNLVWGNYCFDVEMKKMIPIVIDCGRPRHFGFHTINFWFSLLLIVITFSLYLSEPELRAKVKDKCFICYLPFLMLALLSFGEYITVSGIHFLTKYPEVVRIVVLYACLSSFSWLNAMCIHMWRVVTTFRFIPGRSFLIYSLYALGLPLICLIAIIVHENIVGRNKYFSQLTQKGNLLLNPAFLYTINICAVQQIINICIFFRVCYVLWNPVNAMSNNADSSRHLGAQKSKLYQLFVLSAVMGLDFMNIFAIIYFKSNNAFTKNFFIYFNLAPGYIIFITYVLCSRQVRCLLRKRYLQIKNMMD